jgi:16S rRNA (cytosine967-C5)-methyltransferase
VALAKRAEHGRAAGYVNAVLRSLARAPAPAPAPPLASDPAGHVAAAESLPRWIAEEWVAWLGADEALALARAMNGPAPLCARAPDWDAPLARARAAGLAAAPAPRSPDGIVLQGASAAALARAAGGPPQGAPTIERGSAAGAHLVPFQIQDEAAQLVTLFAAGDLRGRRSRVLDACAAPGGKAFHLAELLGPGSEVVAIELHPRKADELSREARRRGLAVRVVCADAARTVPGLEEASFDAVLVDAPCAGLGTLRRHPELKLRRVPGDLARMAALQLDILRSCARWARAGAPITYSVCSLSRGEGPEIAGAMLAAGLHRVPPPPGFPADVLTAEGDLLTLPHRHGTDGFYACRLAR